MWRVRSGPGPERATTTSNRTARVAALALLARRRLTEAQLWRKLHERGYDDDAIGAAIVACKADGYVDDRLYAALYVEGARKPVGDARLRADLVKRGIEREAAAAIVAAAPVAEEERIAGAYEKVRRTQPQLAYPAIARKLERLGFPTSLIYRVLRERAASDFGALLHPSDADA